MKTDIFFSKTTIGVLLVLCLAMTASQANAELKIDSVSQTLGVMGQNLPIIIKGSGFDANTRVSMSLDAENKKAILGSVRFPSPIEYGNNFAISGKMAYVVGSYSGMYNGLYIVDISNPSNLKIISSTTITDAKYVAAIGTKAYIVTDSRFLIIDADNPLNPKILGSADIPISGFADPNNKKPWELARGIAVSDTIAYVADGYKGLQIIDISNSSNPKIIGAYDTGGYVKRVAFSGTSVYAADCMKGLVIIDVRTPSVPKIISTLHSDYGGGIEEVTVSGNMAYIGGAGNSLTMINVSNPYSPIKVSSLNKFYSPTGISVWNDRAYTVSSGASGGDLRVIDISNSQMPKIIGKMSIGTYSITVSENIAYVLESLTLYAIDTTKIISPEVICAIDFNSSTVAVSGTKAYLTNDNLSDQSLRIIEMSNTSNPEIIGSVPIGYVNPRDIAVSSDLKVYIAGYNGLVITDVGDPFHPKVIGQTSPQGEQYWRVQISGTTAYLTCFNPDTKTYFIRLLDVSVPSNPKIIGSVDGDYVAASGTAAYVVKNGVGLKIINVSNPSSPEIVKTLSGQYFGSITVSGNTAYVINGGSLQLMNISDSFNPQIISSMPFPSDTIFGGERIIVSDKTVVFGKNLISVSNLSNPVLIGKIGISADDIAIMGSNALTVTFSDGLVIVPLPLEISPVTVSDSNTLSITLPSPPIPGNYTIRVFNNNGGYFELPGAVTFIRSENSEVILNSKAIIVAGADANLKDEISLSANLAYKALKWQGYNDASIYYLSSNASGAEGVDVPATRGNLSDAINTWAKQNPPASELLLYMVGHGGDGVFQISQTEQISVQELDTWLDNLQNTMSGRITVIYDACFSGSFITDAKGNLTLAPPAGKKRVVITGSANNENAVFLSGGLGSFSAQFWTAVEVGRNLDDAFYWARDMVRSYQKPLLDANGNGISEESEDKSMAGFGLRRQYGKEVVRPKIESVSPAQTLNGQTSATIQAAGVSIANGNISRVWAVIMPPDFDLSKPVKDSDLASVALSATATTGTYQGSFSFTVQGTYVVTIYAEDAAGSQAYPLKTTVTQTSGTAGSVSDSFESDDSSNAAKSITISGGAQHYNFNKIGDEDWIKFYALAGETYKIKASDTGSVCDPVIEIYDSAGNLLKTKNDGSAGEEESADWTCPVKGLYYVRLKNAIPNIFGAVVRYDISVYQPYAPVSGQVNGTVTDSLTKTPIGNVIITTEKRSDISSQSGVYNLENHPTGTYSLTAEAQGYQTLTYTDVAVTASGLIKRDISLTPSGSEALQKGDLNKDKSVNLTDVIIALRVLAGLEFSGIYNIQTDVNGDNRIGMEEVIYILQKVAGLR